MVHICASNLTIIGSDNGLSPSRRQAIIWTNDGILLIRTLGTNFSEILSEIHTLSFKKMHLKISSAKWRPFCLGLNVLSHCSYWKDATWFQWLRARLWYLQSISTGDTAVFHSAIISSRPPIFVLFAISWWKCQGTSLVAPKWSPWWQAPLLSFNNLSVNKPFTSVHLGSLGIGEVVLVAITGTVKLVTSHLVKSLQCIWRFVPIDFIYGYSIFRWVVNNIWKEWKITT